MSDAKSEPEEMRNLMNKLLLKLSFREREILKLRFGLGDQYTYTLEEVGHIFKVTRERVRQIEKKALAKFQVLIAEAEFDSLRKYLESRKQ